MVVEEFHDQKIIYHLNIDEEVNNILMHLSSLKTIKTTYEDETQIRYLMYDRDNQEGTKTQYVYYKNIKSTDGSWSMMDAEILDMYQYDYESKEVKDLQKTSW